MKSTSTVATEYRIGEKVPGTNWVVRSVLGRGGMGVVLDVEKEASGLRMAMKVVHPAFARSGEFTERFLEEVRLLSALRHPNIVDVTDCDTLADGSPYIMMERLEGRTLRQALSDKDIVFAAENVWNIIGQLCSALHWPKHRTRRVPSSSSMRASARCTSRPTSRHGRSSNGPWLSLRAARCCSTLPRRSGLSDGMWTR